MAITAKMNELLLQACSHFQDSVKASHKVEGSFIEYFFNVFLKLNMSINFILENIIMTGCGYKITVQLST